MPDLLESLTGRYALRLPVEPFPVGQGMNSHIFGLRTGGGDFLCKRYQPIHAAASIRYEHRLLGWLADRGLSFAVAAPLPNRAGDTLGAADGSCYALFPFLPGRPVDYANLRQLANVGAGLAELQAALADYPMDARPEMSGFEALGSIHPAIPHPQSLLPSHLKLPDREPFVSRLAWLREEVAGVRAFLDGPFQALPRQVIHGDFVPSNTLHAGARLTAIVDFEFAGPDARAMDVASGLYYSLRVWKGDDPWPRGEAFGRGYFCGLDSGNQARLTAAETAALPWLMRLRNVVSKIFWLGKSLADGTTEERVLGMGDWEIFNRWLAGNGARLAALFEASDALTADRAVPVE